MTRNRTYWLVFAAGLVALSLAMGCAATSYDIEEFSATTGKPVKRAHAAYYGQDKAVQGLTFQMGTTKLSLESAETKDVGTRETAALLREFNQDVLGPLVRAAAKKAGIDVDGPAGVVSVPSGAGDGTAPPTDAAAADRAYLVQRATDCPVLKTQPSVQAALIASIKSAPASMLPGLRKTVDDLYGVVTPK